VAAWDLRTMKKAWDAEPEQEIRWAGPVVTDGDLVFAGALRGFLQPLDADTNKRLWQVQTGAEIMAHR
jgi:outer membrane protein assembly factor BamB